MTADAATILAARSTLDAARYTTRGYDPLPWQVELSEDCDRLVESALAGTGERRLYSAPPRHGKTAHIGVAMPVTAMLRAAALGEPMPILYATSGGDRADEVSIAVRGAIVRAYEATGLEALAPGEVWQRTHWTTVGGLAWQALGWSAGTGGIGCRILLMDDLLGSSEAYRSRSVRERIRRVVREDLLSRIMRGGVAAHMETRRGTEDTTAWLGGEYGDVWQHRVWRCYDPERGYLWPEEYGEAWRATQPHLTDSDPVWLSLYQQEPVPEGGAAIDPAWLAATYTEPPSSVARAADRVVMGVDLSYSARDGSDYAVAVVIAVRDAYRDVLHVWRERCGYERQEEAITQLVRDWGVTTTVIERAANGHAMEDRLRRRVRGLRGESPGGRDKLARLSPWKPVLAAGQVRLPAQGAPWASEFRAELGAFTGHGDAHDDQVDALVWALVAAEQRARGFDPLRLMRRG